MTVRKSLLLSRAALTDELARLRSDDPLSAFIAGRILQIDEQLKLVGWEKKE